MKFSCPACGYEPNGQKNWNCQACNTEFDMFANAGACPTCDFEHEKTACPSFKGGCDVVSPHLAWYSDIDDKLAELGIYKDSDR